MQVVNKQVGVCSLKQRHVLHVQLFFVLLMLIIVLRGLLFAYSKLS